MLLPSKLYAIVDDAVARRHGWPAAALAQAYLRAGVRVLQIRAKEAGSGWFLEACEQVVGAAKPSGALVIVNDRADVARLARAAGVHVGQQDLPPAAVRKVAGEESLIGLSTHTIEQLERARAEPVDYLAIGPVYETGTKEPARPAVGLEMVREAAARAAGRPVVAIGGITLARAPEVLAAGAAAVAVIGDLLATGDPEARARQFLHALGTSHGEPPGGRLDEN